MGIQNNFYPKIFLSCSFHDSRHPVIERLIYKLTQKGASVLRAAEVLNTGNSIAEKIHTAIDDSDYVLIALSGNSSPSAWMWMEYEFAFAKELENKSSKVIVISLDGSDLSKVHFNLVKERGWIDLSEFKIGLQYIKDVVFKSPNDKIISFDIDKIDRYPNIINITSNVDRQIIEYLLKDPDKFYTLNSESFEKLIAELFRGFGYRVELTKRTRDGGRDIIAIKDNELRYKHLIECKRYARDKRISVGVVRALYGLKEHYQATKGILATTAFFTKDALLFFEDHRWELEPKDYNGIMEWIKIYLTQ